MFVTIRPHRQPDGVFLPLGDYSLAKTKTTQSTQTIEQKLKIILEEQIQGSGKIIARLKEIQSALEKTNATKKKVEVSTGKLNEQLFNMGSKLGAVITKAGLYLSVATKVVSTIIKLYDAILNANRVMVRYALLTSNAEQAMKRLREAQIQTKKGWYDFRVSMQDIAGVLADIAEKSIAASAAISMSGRMQSQTAKLLADLQSKLPKGRAQGLVGQFFGDNPSLVSEIMEKYAGNWEKIAAALLAADMPEQARAATQIQRILQETNDQLTQQITNWDNLKNQVDTWWQTTSESLAGFVLFLRNLKGRGPIEAIAIDYMMPAKTPEQPSGIPKSAVADFEELESRVKAYINTLENMKARSSAIGQAMEYSGPTAVLIRQSEQATEALKEQMISLRKNADEQEEIAQKIAASDPLLAAKQLKVAAETRAKAESMVAQILELQLKRYETVLGLVEKEVELQKTNRQIAEATYGSAALSVKAQMNIVQALQKKKILLANELAVVQARLAEEPTSLYLQKQELELRNKMKQVTAEQLQMIKELRDGYLAAVEAQAFGAGKFEKILIQQEQNIGKAMDANIAKKNFLLGKTGGVGISAVAPISFTTAGVGYLERGGELMSDEDIRKANEQAMLGVGGGTAEMSAAVTDMVIEGLDDVGNSLGSNTDALNRLSDGLNNFATRVGVMPSPATPAGQTRTSEPMRTAGAAGATLSSAGGGYFTNMARNGLNQVLKAIEGLEENSTEEYTPSRSLPSGTSIPLAP